MSILDKRSSLIVLQWVLGLVILAESAGFAFSPGAARAFAKTGMPNFVRIGLAYAEMAAAVMFLIPRTTMAGGRFLIAVLVAAIGLHLMHGWLDVGSLVIDIAATWAVMAARGKSAGEPQT